MWDSMKVICWFEKKYPDYMLLISSDYMYNKTKIKVVRIKDSLTIGTMEFDICEKVSLSKIKTELSDIVHKFENLTTTYSFNNTCPNCGAIHNGVKCEYCDAVFVSNICSKDIRQEYINECYRLACQEQRLKMGFFDCPIPKHLL